jgi:thioesterase domain-containing protein
MAMAEWIGAIPGGGWIPSLRRDREDGAAMLAGLGELYVRGLEIDWNRLHGHMRWRRAELPTYPFQRRRYWRTALASPSAQCLATGSETAIVETEPSERAFLEQLRAASAEERHGLLTAHLRAVLAGLVGEVAASIPVDGNLLGHGLDSLRIMSLLSAVQRTAGCVCTPADFISRPTLRDFARYLEERVASATLAIEPGSASSRVTVATSQLVALRTEGSTDPIFCPHPAGGEVTAYLRLTALLGADRPLYAIQSRAGRNPDGEHESLAMMASDYADIVQRARPGPYVLLGWSMGGVVGHAVAAELEQRGQHVRLVAMIDPPPPAGLELDDMAAALRAAILEVRPEQATNERLPQLLRDLLSRSRESSLLEVCEQQGLLERGSISAEALEAMVRLRRRHVQLVRTHRPGVIRADMAIWWAREPRTPREWSRHTRGHLTERSLGGSHYTVVLPPHIEVIATELRILCGEPLAAAAELPSRASRG